MKEITLIDFNSNSKTPKYKQVINSIISKIDNGSLKRGQQLPSINEISEKYNLSRDTIEKAYAELKERGIISSVRGKGYYINNTESINKIKVFLLFNKLSDYKKTVYNSFVQTLGENAVVDLFIHHNNLRIFKSLISESIGNYGFYVIIPPYFESIEKDEVMEAIEHIPKNKLLILDRPLNSWGGWKDCASVYQDFENDIYEALQSEYLLIKKYKNLTLIFPELSSHSKDVKIGFEKFCLCNSIPYRIIDDFKEQDINAKEAFIVVTEEDLVKLIKLSRGKNLLPGKTVGIISYNETPLKEILSEGITVISTDFAKMGETAARLVLSKKKEKIKNPFTLIKRNSL